MRFGHILAAAWLVIAASGVAAQEKGGEDLTGPYDVVQGWPKLPLTVKSSLVQVMGAAGRCAMAAKDAAAATPRVGIRGIIAVWVWSSKSRMVEGEWDCGTLDYIREGRRS